MPVLYVSEPIYHYELEQGNIFHWSHHWDDVAVGANVNMRLYTGSLANRVKHFTFTISAVGVVKIELFESTRGINGGTLVPAIALNRVLAATIASDSVVYRDVTVAGYKGTLLETMILPGAAAGGLGGTVTDLSSWHLLNDEMYLLQVQNLSAATCDISVTIERIIETAYTRAG
jgi:hypothetical protein